VSENDKTMLFRRRQLPFLGITFYVHPVHQFDNIVIEICIHHTMSETGKVKTIRIITNLAKSQLIYTLKAKS